MSVTLERKVVLITGSGSGMGRSHAVLMAERGARVVVHDIDPDRVAETADLVRAAGSPPHEICVDMRDIDALANAIAETERDYGPVDVLVNNAGIGGQGLALGDIDIATFDAMFQVHVRGTFFATRAVVPGMKARRAGKIVNISSNFAMGGSHFASQYAAAKSAISGLTKSWAREFRAVQHRRQRGGAGASRNQPDPGLDRTRADRGNGGGSTARTHRRSGRDLLRGRLACLGGDRFHDRPGDLAQWRRLNRRNIRIGKSYGEQFTRR